jgi:serine/threonine protein kinase/uncharacterized small protein (DUF1192 family)
MPLADRNLDTIFRSEQPDKVKARALAKDLAEAIEHVHSKDLVHGDVKLTNVVRFDSRLCLIDLDAAVKINSLAGAKFSSGVLPPEMIQELDFQDCEMFDRYFEEIKREDADKWAKVDPKQFGDDSKFFAVKTFLTEEKIVWKKQRGETEKLAKTEYHPVDVELLPYTLVKATTAIDIWSFGVVLYSLVTGSSLFAVNRNDDLFDATAMKDLYEWDKTKQMAKLKLINDPLAYKLLVKVLSPEPSDRYDSMKMLLRDDYFDEKNLTEHFVDWQKTMVDAIREQTVELRNTKKEIIAKIKGSTSVTLTAIFEATEVQTPTCFVILPEELSFSLSDTGDRIENMGSKVDYVGDILDKATDCIGSPFTFAASFIKSTFIESTMFLYLVDESTGKRVDGGVYPVKIDVRSAQAEKFLPLMALGMQVLATTNKALGIINMFYPGVPSTLIPKVLLDKVSLFIGESNKSGIINQVVRQGSTGSETVRGNDLREFAAFLREMDPACTFSGLRRICDKSSGEAMWVTEESAKSITHENEAANENDEEVSRLRTEIPNVEEVNRLRIESQQQEISRLTAALLRVENQQQAAESCCAIS